MADPETVNAGVVGATGAVGGLMMTLLAQEARVGQMRAFASPASVAAGKTVEWRGQEIALEDAATADLGGIAIALFSANANISRDLAPRFTTAGALVVDNSSAWRHDERVPLVVSEVNPEALDNTPLGIISNPNCSTMEIMPVIKPLHDEAELTGMTVVTQQAVSGTGKKGVDELAKQARELIPRLHDLMHGGPAMALETNVFPDAVVAFNSISLAGKMVPGSSETDEEHKIRYESRKILGLPDLPVTPVCWRSGTVNGHSVTVIAQFRRPLSSDRANELLDAAPGVELTAVPTVQQATGRDEILVGRIREAEATANGLVLCIAGDNLRKGAALNAVQITQLLLPRLM